MPSTDEVRRLEDMDLPDDPGASAQAILEDAIEYHDPSHIFGMFSGGHDSLCATSVASMSERFTGAAHINTGIGISQTRQFVRETCREQGWELYEYRAPEDQYDRMVLEQGFPHGPDSHNSMLYHLKQKQWNRLAQDAKTEWRGRPKRNDRILFVTGVRRSESNRRMAREMSEPWLRKGCRVWVNPILLWDKLDENRYMKDAGLRRNPVVDTIHKSGECLCGAYAKREELKEIAYWYPEAAERIYELERRARERRLIDCKWAQSQAPGKTWDDDPAELESMVDLQLCMSCVAPDDKPMPTSTPRTAST